MELPWRRQQEPCGGPRAGERLAGSTAPGLTRRLPQLCAWYRPGTQVVTLPPASARVVPWHPHSTLLCSILIPGTPSSVGSPFLLVSLLGSLCPVSTLSSCPVRAAWPHTVQPPLGCSSYCQATVGQRLSLDQGLGSRGKFPECCQPTEWSSASRNHRAGVLPCCCAVRNGALPQVRVPIIYFK